MTTLRQALLVLLDQVDYTAAACGPTEMVGAVLPIEVIRLARQALAEDAGEPPEPPEPKDAATRRSKRRS